MDAEAQIDRELLHVAERLPTAPRILVELGGIIDDAYVEMDDVIELLRQDAPLAAQIIRMSNCAIYASPIPVGSLERALIVLGFAEVHRLVGAVAASQLAEQEMRMYPIDGPRLRMNTLFVAVFMEELARWTGERPRSCYTIGLLRPIGMMALERMKPRIEGLRPFLESGETVLDEWERKTWGITNSEAAEHILTHWRLPHDTVSAIRHHYRPTGLQHPLIHLLTLAASAAADIGYAIPGEQHYWELSSKTFSKAGLDPSLLPIVTERAQRKFAQLNLLVE